MKARSILISLCAVALLTFIVARAQQTLTGRAYVSLSPVAVTTTSIGGNLLLAGACNTVTVSAPGATTSMAVVVSPASGTSIGIGIDWFGQVTSAGTVTVSECAIVAATPTSSTFNVRVIP
jgi:hypothetical protein